MTTSTGAVEIPRVNRLVSWILDGALVVAAGTFALPYLLRDQGRHLDPHWLAYLGAAALIVPLLVRRVWPLQTFVAVLAIAVGFGAWDARLVTSLALPAALYTVAARCPRRQAYLAAAALEVLVVVISARLAGGALLAPLVLLTGMVAAALGLGLYAATRRDYVQELVARAARLEHEREQDNLLAAATERGRIAREMHDIVAHHLTVMVSLSDAATRQLPVDPLAAARTMTSVATTGRDALRDTRRLLGVLEEDAHDAGLRSQERRPTPDLDALDDLVDQVRAAGYPVDLTLNGSPAGLAADAQLAIYRLVQEALTNTMKHAGPGARSTVALDVDGTAAELTIADDGAGNRVADARPGRGTSGMQARVDALHGHLESRPGTCSGWVVRALLPGGDEAAPLASRRRAAR